MSPNDRNAGLPGFQNQIQVDKELVSLLSDSTYTSFAHCIRELVVNAYDADSTEVSIEFRVPSFSPETQEPEFAGEMRIRDNGAGMSVEDFIRFTRIAPGGRRGQKTGSYLRRRVGKFGIGYLAAFPFCRELVVRTTSGGDPRTVVGHFPCAAYLQKLESFRSIEEVKVEAFFEIARSRYQRVPRGTELILRGLSRDARRYLVEGGSSPGRAGSRVDSIYDWDGIRRLRWELGQTLPIRWTGYERWEKDLGIERDSRDPGLSVTVGGEQLVKPWPFAAEKGDELISLPAVDGSRLRTLSTADVRRLSGVPGSLSDLRPISYRYLVVSPKKALEPEEMRGVQIRLQGVAVGLPLKYQELPGRVRTSQLIRMFVEVHLLEGFDDDITIDRSTFKRSPWFLALLRDLDENVLKKAQKYGAVEKRVQEAIKALQSQKASIPREDLLARVRQEATSAGFAVKQESSIRIEDASIDHENGVVRLPSELPQTKIVIDGERYSLVLGSGTDPVLEDELLVLRGRNRLVVWPGLREQLRPGVSQYPRLLARLAMVELRKVRCCRTARTDQAAFEFLAREIKQGLANEARKQSEVR
jgi:hypothetical protein